MTRRRMATFWIAAQLLFLAGWAGYEQARLAPGEGVSILVRTVPVDPRDLLRGQYLRLAYEFSQPVPAGLADGAAVWAVLAPDPDEPRFHVPVRAAGEAPRRPSDAQVALRGRVQGSRCVFGIERFFVPEGSETPDRAHITVLLRVGSDGRARIEQVYVRGDPWP